MNNITDKGADALIDLLKANPTIQELVVTDNEFSDAKIAQLKTLKLKVVDEDE